MAPRFQSRQEWFEAIALAMGFDDIDDLSIEIQGFLNVQNEIRLEIVLQIAETAATNCLSYTSSETDAKKLSKLRQMALAHADNNKSRPVRDLMGEVLEIIDEEEDFTNA
jgi:hypothetical protein